MRILCGTIFATVLRLAAFGAATLSTGVEIPDDGAPTWEGGMQYTTRAERRPAAITNEAMYLKWKWRMNLANPATGLDNDALRDGVKKIVAESGWKDGKEDWYDVAARCFDFLVDNVAIGFSKYDCFPAISAWDRHRRPMSAVLWSHAADVDDKYSPGLRSAIARNRTSTSPELKPWEEICERISRRFQLPWAWALKRRRSRHFWQDIRWRDLSLVRCGGRGA